MGNPNTWFRIGAEEIDADAVESEIRETVERKTADGRYADTRIAAGERTHLVGWQAQEEFADCFLRRLRETAFVDITDFEIHERRSGLALLLVRLKRAIWALLRFYTYRLWSQQNEVNGLLVTGLEGVDEKLGERIQMLEARVAELERTRAASDKSE